VPVHDIAVRGFGSAAEEYERGRPGYPTEVAELLRSELGLGPGRSVLDVGAGTGKFTRLLATTGARVLALEPVDAMRAQLQAAVPQAELVGGSAEEIALRAGAVDVVTTATAFHWFDGPRALAEFRRVLTPGGGLAVVWNLRDESVDWVRSIGELVGAAVEDGGDAEHARHLAETDSRAAFEQTRFFEPLRKVVIPHVHETDVETQVARFLSISFVAALPAERRARLAADIEQLLRTHPATRERVAVPYLCELYLYRSVAA
jgi:ubiquinone/menaquinone biosynthesis C-methylase UbiE